MLFLTWFLKSSFSIGGWIVTFYICQFQPNLLVAPTFVKRRKLICTPDNLSVETAFHCVFEINIRLFLFIPISVSEPLRIILNQSEKRFISRLMKNGQKSIRLNPINSETTIRINQNQSETKVSIQFIPNQSDLGLIRTEFSIRFNPNHSTLGFIRIHSNWKFAFYQSELGLIRIDPD